jgi:hypothetical protein
MDVLRFPLPRMSSSSLKSNWSIVMPMLSFTLCTLIFEIISMLKSYVSSIMQ